MEERLVGMMCLCIQLVITHSIKINGPNGNIDENNHNYKISNYIFRLTLYNEDTLINHQLAIVNAAISLIIQHWQRG